MTMKLKKAVVAAGLVIAATVGFAAPALASDGEFNACLPAWQVATTVKNGYHNNGSYASIEVYPTSQYGGNFWVTLPGQGQCASSVTVDAGETGRSNYYSTFSGGVSLMAHQVGWGPNGCDLVTGYVNFN